MYKILSIATGILFSIISSSSNAGLINGGFEDPIFSPGQPSVDYPTAIPGWETTDRAFEVWSDGFLGVDSYEGNQHVELNAFNAGTLYQDVGNLNDGDVVGYEFAHRARTTGIEIMRLVITDFGVDNLFGTSDDTELFNDTFTGVYGSWTLHTGSNITALGHDVRFAYSADNGVALGNFLDAADFGVGVGVVSVPEPSSIILFGLSLLGFVSRMKFIKK